MASAASVAILLASSTLFAAEPPSNSVITAALEGVGGTPAKNAVVLTAMGGWPFSSLRAQVGLTHRLALESEVESVVGLRYRPMLGVGMRLANATHLRVTGDALIGWLFQRGEEIRRGPNCEIRLRVAIPMRRFVPYVVLATRHAFLPDLTIIERASGEDRTWSVRHEWTPWGTLGVGFGISRWFGIDVGLDYGWVDAPTSVALPGIHLGLHFGEIR